VGAVIKTRPAAMVLATLGLDRVVKDHPQRLGGAVTAASPSRFKRTDPVTYRASTNAVTVAPESPGRFEVVLEIAPGYHVNAHKPGIEYLIPLRVALVGAEGLELRVDYPAGEKFQGPEGLMLVHHGTVKVPVTVERTGPVTGRPRVMLTYQVCTDKVCMEPKTEQVGIRIVVGE
jgi:DsbC/DsbD-like thiol-disulfide interchange protein